MFFASDNWAGAHPKIVESLARHSGGYEPAYGNGVLDRKVGEKFSEIFEREVDVFFVGTGTAANSLALTLFSRPGGVGFYHEGAHALADECGAPEYLSGGTRLCPVGGALGRIDPKLLEKAIARYPVGSIHSGRPVAVSITQLTEVGTAYSLENIKAISAICHREGLPLHMDGARFANALDALGATPAEMTWKGGVDILSFGGTKNGCWCAEAIVLFDKTKATEMKFIQKRAAQLFSKSRFVAAQFVAYLEDDLWLATARKSNTLAAKLAGHIRTSGSNRIRLAWEPQANEVFAIVSAADQKRLRDKGAVFYTEATPRELQSELQQDEAICRFVTSFATTDEQIDLFGELLR